jgi:type II secretory pathway component PulF
LKNGIKTETSKPMAYKYQAYTMDKKIVQGTIEVSSESLAEGALYHAGYQRIISLKEIPPGTSIKGSIPTLFGVKTQDIIDFSNQLATLVESGIAIMTALQLLKGQASKASLKETIASLTDKIQVGSSFSQALSHHSDVFPNTYIQVIRASEQAGSLEIGLRQASGYMAQQAATASKIKRAMFYPVFVLLMAVGVVIMLITVALPPLVELFASFDVELPWTTQTLLAVSGFVLDNGMYLVAGAVILILLVIGLLRVPSIKLAKDRAMLKIPLIGGIIIERGVQHFCQTASMLLKAGLHITQVMDIAVQTNKNPIIRQSLHEVKEKLVQGEGLSQPLSEVKQFPPLVGEMALVGEKTGTMESTLDTLSNYYEQRVERRISILTSMIEPLLTLIIGLVIMGVALAIITPLYSILKQIG